VGLEEQRSSACLDGASRGVGCGVFVASGQAVTTATSVRGSLGLGEELVLRLEDGRELAVVGLALEFAPSKREIQMTGQENNTRRNRQSSQPKKTNKDGKPTWRRRPKGLLARFERAALRRRRATSPP